MALPVTFHPPSRVKNRAAKECSGAKDSDVRTSLKMNAPVSLPTSYEGKPENESRLICVRLPGRSWGDFIGLTMRSGTFKKPSTTVADAAERSPEGSAVSSTGEKDAATPSKSADPQYCEVVMKFTGSLHGEDLDGKRYSTEFRKGERYPLVGLYNPGSGLWVAFELPRDPSDPQTKLTRSTIEALPLNDSAVTDC